LEADEVKTIQNNFNSVDLDMHMSI